MVTQVPARAPKRTDGRAACVHYWIVRPPDGPTSWGVCRHCGRRKRFTNRFDGRDRSNNSDLFVDGSLVWRPDRRATYYPPPANSALDEAAARDL